MLFEAVSDVKINNQKSNLIPEGNVPSCEQLIWVLGSSV